MNRMNDTDKKLNDNGDNNDYNDNITDNGSEERIETVDDSIQPGGADDASAHDKREKRTLTRFVKSVLFLLGSLAAIFGFAAMLSMLSNSSITAVNYDLRPKADESESVRIVFLSDLHRVRFDKTNQKLVDTVAEQQPDVICIGGDMLETRCTPQDVYDYGSLIERLSAIAPVFFIPGNHDYKLFFLSGYTEKGEYLYGRGRSNIRNYLESCGAVFLECGYADMIIKNMPVRIGGMYGRAYRMAMDTDEFWNERKGFLERFTDTDSYKIMLCHRHNSFIDGNATENWDVDLVISGHTHNGVVCMPFGLGPVYTHDGLFSKYGSGEFKSNDTTIIISGGLAGLSFVPRVFNPPEIAVIDIAPKR